MGLYERDASKGVLAGLDWATSIIKATWRIPTDSAVWGSHGNLNTHKTVGRAPRNFSGGNPVVVTVTKSHLLSIESKFS